MKSEYDFSKGERGKFYREGADFRVPVYLDSEAMTFVSSIARKRKVDVSKIVNDIVRRDIKAARTSK